MGSVFTYNSQSIPIYPHHISPENPIQLVFRKAGCFLVCPTIPALPPHREEPDLWGCRRSHCPDPVFPYRRPSVICLACRIIASHSTSGSLLPPSPEIYHNSSVPYSRPALPVCGSGHPSDSGGTDIQPLRWNGLPRGLLRTFPYIVKAGIRQMGDVRDHSRRSISVTKSRPVSVRPHAASLPSDPRIPVSPFSVSIAVVGFSPAQLLLPVPGIFS